ncbi:MAG TPA: hypothetical protein VNJ01_17955 [Bacteriovoracaceae bacterium]|nr:hypothetical protein [Bacteriovoracaceae bacterium]
MSKSGLLLFLNFFAASWLSNDWIIRTTGKLVQTSSLEMVLAVSSLSGIVFFLFLKGLTSFQRPLVAAFTMIPMWVILAVSHEVFPAVPVIPTILAILLGETMKWHAYSQVLNRYTPFSAGKIIGYSVLAYELGTMASSATATIGHRPLILSLNLVALILIHLPFLLRSHSEEPTSTSAALPVNRSSVNLLSWILLLGAFAGFLKVSSDTGFKFAIRQSTANPTEVIANFYLLSSIFTIGLWLLKKQRWVSSKFDRPEVAVSGMAVVQCLFGAGLLTAPLSQLIVISSLQRSFDKIFYQPTIQLLASGFSSFTQERIRRYHSSAFLGIGSLLGLLAFAASQAINGPEVLLKGISILHLLASLAFVLIGGFFFRRLISAFDEESSGPDEDSCSRAMAMLALLSPKHFLTHALIWSKKKGGFHTLPPEILQGLSSSQDSDTLRSFYLLFSKLDEPHQAALIKLAILLDKKRDRVFLKKLAEEKIPCSKKSRKVAALHLVKVHGKSHRPLLRRARGINSPLKKAA